MQPSRKSPHSKSRTFVRLCRRVCYPRLTLSKRAPSTKKLTMTNIHSVLRSILYGTVSQHKLISKPHQLPPQNNNGIPENYPDKRTNGLTQNGTTHYGKRKTDTKYPQNLTTNITSPNYPLTIRSVTNSIPTIPHLTTNTLLTSLTYKLTAPA